MKKTAKKSTARKKTRSTRSKVRSHRSSARKRGLQPLNVYWTLGMVSGICVVALGLWVAHRPTDNSTNPTEVSENGSPALPTEFGQAKNLDMGDRIAYWSRKLADEPQSVAQIPDAPQIDDVAPLVPPQYDCTTFVETVAALARSRTAHSFYRNLLTIRYRDGKATFEARNHFPEADWIPNNEKAGILQDITASVAEATGVEAKIESKDIDRAGWLAQQVHRGHISRSVASVAETKWTSPVHAAVPYISIGDADKVLDKIPNGTILNIVRKSDAGRPVLITHQGFVIRSGGRVLLRHASVGGTIRTSILATYLHHLEQTRMQNWPVIGFNLNQVNQ